MNGIQFIIKDFPNDVYNAVGQIIKASQEWEQDFKKLASLLNIPVKKICKFSLNKLNDALKKYDLISDKEFKDLKTVINVRNYINHGFFLNDYNKSNEEIEQQLNLAQFLIFEATDLINNKIDELNGCDIFRPTIFD